MPSSLPHQTVDFAHSSERTFARLLDFYDVAWDYEPTTFVLDTDDEGQVRTAFTPDFYLPEYDIYIEITTLRQSLVTKKNRKMRKLRQAYPEVTAIILYQRDYQQLIQKYQIAS
jgi:hypothetical protein